MQINFTLFAQLVAFVLLALITVGVTATIIWWLRLRTRRGTEQRLATLDALLAQGAITHEEHARQRASIIAGV